MRARHRDASRPRRRPGRLCCPSRRPGVALLFATPRSSEELLRHGRTPEGCWPWRRPRHRSTPLGRYTCLGSVAAVGRQVGLWAFDVFALASANQSNHRNCLDVGGVAEMPLRKPASDRLVKAQDRGAGLAFCRADHDARSISVGVDVQAGCHPHVGTVPFCIDFTLNRAHSNRTRSCPAQPGTCPPDHRGHVSNVARPRLSSSDSKEDRQVAVDEPVSELSGAGDKGFRGSGSAAASGVISRSLNASVIASLIRA